MGYRVLMLEDELELTQTPAMYFEQKGAELVCCATEEEAKAQFKKKGNRFDLAILDIIIGSNDRGGLDVCAWMRRNNICIPVIFATVYKDEQHINDGFDYGCAHYIKKDYESYELYIYAKNAIEQHRRLTASKGPILSIGGVTLDANNPNFLRIDGNPEKWDRLPTIHYKLLRILMETAGRTCRREDLVTEVWEYEYDPKYDADKLKQPISELRKKLGEKSGLIQTVEGVGYRFKGEEELK